MELRAIGGRAQWWRASSTGWSCAGLVGVLIVASACQRESAGKRDKRSSVSPSASQLDGMQLSAARRVALESATAAMQRRDVERLKQLAVWVRHRAQVPILEPDDIKALDLAIQCLEQVSPPNEALATLDALKSGGLRKEARTACLGRASE